MTRSSQSIEVRWMEVVPIDRNGIITMYEIRYEPMVTFGGMIRTETVNVMAPMLTETLVDLEEFVSYTISVRAFTSVGEGPYSDGMTIMTPSDRKNRQLSLAHAKYLLNFNSTCKSTPECSAVSDIGQSDRYDLDDGACN